MCVYNYIHVGKRLCKNGIGYFSPRVSINYWGLGRPVMTRQLEHYASVCVVLIGEWAPAITSTSSVCAPRPSDGTWEGVGCAPHLWPAEKNLCISLECVCISHDA